MRDHCIGNYSEFFKDDPHLSLSDDDSEGHPSISDDDNMPAAASVTENKRPHPLLEATPKAKVAKTAVAAVGYRPFEDNVGALPGAATGDVRRANKKLLEAKLDVVQLALDNPETLSESVRHAKKG